MDHALSASCDFGGDRHRGMVPCDRIIFDGGTVRDNPYQPPIPRPIFPFFLMAVPCCSGRSWAASFRNPVRSQSSGDQQKPAKSPLLDGHLSPGIVHAGSRDLDRQNSMVSATHPVDRMGSLYRRCKGASSDSPRAMPQPGRPIESAITIS